MTTVKQLAGEFGMDRSHARKWVLAQGVDIQRVRDVESSQLVLAVSDADAAELRDRRRSLGFSVGLEPRKAQAENGAGVFYVVCPDPDARPNRLKLGFSSSMSGRMDAYRTANPDAKLIKTWPCRRVWEPAAMHALTVGVASQVRGEVYDTENVEAVMQRGDAFFGFMK